MSQAAIASRSRRRTILYGLQPAAVLGIAHGFGDGAAGFLLGGLAHMLPLPDVALLVLLYNALAFGAQPFVGALLDRVGRLRGAALLGLALICAALLLVGGHVGGQVQVHGDPPVLLRVAVALAGLGGALFHVGGGALALQSSSGRAAGPGLFAAPGVVGLAAGGALAAPGWGAWWVFLPPLLLVAALIVRLSINGRPTGAIGHAPISRGEARSAVVVGPSSGVSGQKLREAHFDTHDLVMIVLLAAIALRSAVWNTVELLFHGRYEALLGLACAAALGKLLGGPLADLIGWRRYVVAALACAAPLLTIAGDNMLLLLPGVALLQSATPAALAALSRQLPRSPATAAGLGFGLAIAIGGLPILGGIGPPLHDAALRAVLCLAAALAMWLALRDRGYAPSPATTPASAATGQRGRP